MNNRFVEIGQIVTAHGVRGGLKVKSFTENPCDLFSFTPFWVGDQQTASWMRFSSVGKNFLIAFLSTINDRTAALALRGQFIRILRTQLPIDPGCVYYVDLQGRPVVDTCGQPVGCVGWVHDFGAGPVLEMKDTGQMVSFNDVENADEPILRLVYSIKERSDNI